MVPQRDCMKTLADIPVTSEDILKALADIAAAEPSGVAPGAAQKTVPPPKKPPNKVENQSRGGGQLGAMDIGAYLDHYQVKYEIVDRAGSPGRVVYGLYHCLFNLAHGKNEASIIQDPSGLITYHC